MQFTRLRATWPFQALADETRLRVIRVLATADGPLTAGQLASVVASTPSHLSRHLQVLEIAKVTSTERRGRWHYISLSDFYAATGPLCAAVLALEDEDGVFSADMGRLLQSGALAGAPTESAAAPGESERR